MKNIFKLKEFPYLLTLLFGLATFQLSQIFNTIVDSPTIEYNLQANNKRNVGNKIIREISCTITNISRTKSLDDIKINMLFDNNDTSSRIYNPEIVIINPSSLHNTGTGFLDSLLVEYSVKKLQPGFKYILTCTTERMDEIEKYPKLFLTTTDSIRLVEASFSTFVTKNYLTVNGILFLIWVTLIVSYLIFLQKNKPI